MERLRCPGRLRVGLSSAGAVREPKIRAGIPLEEAKASLAREAAVSPELTLLSEFLDAAGRGIVR